MSAEQGSAASAPRVGEYGYRGSGQWGYTCSLCWRPFGPFRTEAAARKYGDQHASECRNG